MNILGYDRTSILKRFTPQDDEAIAIRYVGLLRQNKLNDVEDYLDPSVKDAGITGGTVRHGSDVSGGAANLGKTC